MQHTHTEKQTDTETGSCNLMQRETANKQQQQQQQPTEGALNVTSSQPFAECPLFPVLSPMPVFAASLLASTLLSSIWQYLAFVQIKVKVSTEIGFKLKLAISAVQSRHSVRSGTEWKSKREHTESTIINWTQSTLTCAAWRSQTKNVIFSSVYALSSQMNSPSRLHML